MVGITWDNQFLRILKKWKRKHSDLIVNFQDKLTQFTDNPFQASLKTHSLSGKLNGYWAFNITYEYRLVFKFISDNKALLIDIGTHDEVY
ncbi:MAG: type II toxin-antitoxin system RelE/ParE family toxin, partial [Candidatus Anammoxibacter sp.]